MGRSDAPHATFVSTRPRRPTKKSGASFFQKWPGFFRGRPRFFSIPTFFNLCGRNIPAPGLSIRVGMSKTDGTDERQRIRRILSGETGEYAYFVRTYSSQVLDLVSRLVADRSDAEELAQDAFVRAFRSLDSFDGRSSFLTWLMRIAYRTALNHLKRRRQHWVSIDRLLLPDPPDDGLDTGLEERISQLETLVEQLPPDERLLLHLYYYEDHPLRDISYIVDAEPATLASRLHRIRKKLLLMMNQNENETAQR